MDDFTYEAGDTVQVYYPNSTDKPTFRPKIARVYSDHFVSTNGQKYYWRNAEITLIERKRTIVDDMLDVYNETEGSRLVRMRAVQDKFLPELNNTDPRVINFGDIKPGDLVKGTVVHDSEHVVEFTFRVKGIYSTYREIVDARDITHRASAFNKLELVKRQNSQAFYVFQKAREEGKDRREALKVVANEFKLL